MVQKTTPMMQQYHGIKAQHKDAVLFFRLGDFYEMFDDDAIEVSRLLNLTLTKRGDCPMCGVPYHASKIYIGRLLRAGKKIAICEQVSTPIPGELTDRKVIEIITPGTATESDFLESGTSNYLASIYCGPKESKTENNCGFAYIDVSTGNFFATSFKKNNLLEELAKELIRIKPNEILFQHSMVKEFPAVKEILDSYSNLVQNPCPDWSFTYDVSIKRMCSCFNVDSLKAFGLSNQSAEIPPAGLILEYLEQTAGNILSHITSINIYSENDYLSLDESTQKNLELLTNLRDNTTDYTLFEVVNNTKTGMGTRLLRDYIAHPLCNKTELESRLEKVESLYKNEKAITKIRTILRNILDIERLIGKIAMGKANGKDLLALKQSLISTLELYNLSKDEGLFFLHLNSNSIQDLNLVIDILEDSINEECSILLTDGNLIKPNWSKKLDELKHIHNHAHEVLSKYLEDEKEKTGLQKIKIKYNKINGYFIEITKNQLNNIPEHFQLIRNLVNGSRFTTTELNQIEEKINIAEEKIVVLEKQIYMNIIEKLKSYMLLLQALANNVAELDVFQSFAYTAIINAWCKPTLNATGLLQIIEGRHPVVEAHIETATFVPNNTILSTDTESISLPMFSLITGPNMAGKSTFLRQTALIVLLAQIGSFVPAQKANISICDKIFCRVGASDNLAKGESTFLVEMIETAYILRNATQNSLIIMDEVGRGTSTEDGLAIAQAVSEHILNTIKAKTLFATHYHELSLMEHPQLSNLCLSVLEAEGKIVFLKKVIEGSSASSYGIHVAGLAGIPKEILQRANSLIHVIHTEKANNNGDKENTEIISPPHLFSEEELIINEVISTNPDELKPIDALQLIDEWKKRLMNNT